MIKIAPRIAAIKPSATLSLAQKAKEMKAQGIDVINLTAGEPDFATPENIRSAAIEAIERNESGYTAGAGILPLREAIVSDAHRRYQWDLASNNVLVSTGAKQSLFNTEMCIPVTSPFSPKDTLYSVHQRSGKRLQNQSVVKQAQFSSLISPTSKDFNNTFTSMTRKTSPKLRKLKKKDL